jgi:hypothetical protein
MFEAGIQDTQIWWRIVTGSPPPFSIPSSKISHSNRHGRSASSYDLSTSPQSFSLIRASRHLRVCSAPVDYVRVNVKLVVLQGMVNSTDIYGQRSYPRDRSRDLAKYHMHVDVTREDADRGMSASEGNMGPLLQAAATFLPGTVSPCMSE